MKNPRALFIALMSFTMNHLVYAESILATKTGNEVGMSLSSYQYQEPGVMTNKGLKIGGEYRATQTLSDKFWVRGDVRLAMGSVNYSSPASGSANGEPDWYLEGRGLVGNDAWSFNNLTLVPYAGLGYRYLFNDARGITNTGFAGYRRESNYLYLPLGIIGRMTMENTAQLVTEAEYDQLILGKQFTKLSDAGLGYSDVSNNQNSGYGLKLSVKYEKDNWGVGPYANYWNINRSAVVPEIQNGVPTGFGLVEPKNNTVEFGLKASVKF